MTPVRRRMTQEDADMLADLIWFIKGYLTATDDRKFFGEEHTEALRKARVNALVDIETRERAAKNRRKDKESDGE